MTVTRDVLTAVELHAVEDLLLLVREGLDPNALIQGKPPLTWLTEMYTRSDRFPDCVRVLLEAGARLADPALAPVLLDDASAVSNAVHNDRSLLAHQTTLVSAFTPLVGASLLHVAAEYGNANATRALLAAGADTEARAATDEWGYNGQTPLFHTVSSPGNHAAPILHMLLAAGASTDVRLDGITWGKGFDWETTFFDLTPIAYAQCGLYPQVHRTEAAIYENIQRLLAAGARPVSPLRNVPNRYLRPRVNISPDG